jgi:hypothetical protein
MNIAELVKEYREIRDSLSIKRKEFETYEKAAKDDMEHLEMQMLAISNDTGVDSFKTEYGTVFKTTKTYARLDAGEESKELRNQYIMATGDFGFITGHISKAHVEELIQEGIDPSTFGVVYERQLSMQFRK